MCLDFQRKTVPQQSTILVHVLLFFLILSSALAFAEPATIEVAKGSRLSIIWKSPGSGDSGSFERELQSWAVSELTHSFKRASRMEKDPATDTLVRWGGVSLADLIDKVVMTLPPDQSAQVDLVVLKDVRGVQAFVPRSLITKYPVMLATQRDKTDLSAVQVIMPWTTKPKIMSEYLPIENYFVSNLVRIELSNYHEQYPLLFLKRRTDPSAMRGEKLFVQNCTACHASGRGPSIVDIPTEARIRSLASFGHPDVKGTPKLTARDRRALVNYLEAYRHQNAIAKSQ